MWRCVDFESPIGGDRAKTCYRNDDLLILVCGFCWCGGRIFTEKSRIGSLELLSVDFSRFQSVSVGFSRFQSVSVGFSCLFRFRDTSVFRGFVLFCLVFFLFCLVLFERQRELEMEEWNDRLINRYSECWWHTHATIASRHWGTHRLALLIDGGFVAAVTSKSIWLGHFFLLVVLETPLNDWWFRLVSAQNQTGNMNKSPANCNNRQPNKWINLAVINACKQVLWMLTRGTQPFDLESS